MKGQMMDIQHLRADYLWNKFQVDILHSKNAALVHDSSVLTILPFLIISLLILFVLFLLIRVILNMKKSLQEPSILLELTPPAFTEKTAYTTAQLFSVIHRLGRDKTFLERLLGRKTRFSFEIVSTRMHGIRYVIRTKPKEVNSVKRDLLSYLPGVQVKTVNEYLPENIKKQDLFHTKVIEFTQAKPFPYPLQRQDMLEEHDPVAYITGQMTKLSPGELISFQIVLSPTQTKEARIIKQKIFRGEDVLRYVNSLNSAFNIKVLGIFTTCIRGLLGIVGWAVSTLANDAADPYRAKSQTQARFQMQSLAASQLKPARMITSFEQQAIQSIERKIDQPLFETRIRLLLVMKDKSDLQERVKGFTSSLDVFSGTEHQSLRRKPNLINNIFGHYLFLNFQKRLLSFVFNSSSDLLSSSEISDIYHFPFTNVTQTENIVKSYSHDLPAPVSLKQGTKFDVVFGKNTYGGEETLIGLTADQRARHMVIFGGTGNGKTTLISEMIQQDMNNGKGICFVDPHGDAAERLLQMVPKNREEDVVWVDPYDIDRPFAINLMELTPNLKQNDALREKERVAEGIVSLFRRVCSTDFSKAGSNAFRIENTLLNAIYTAFYVPDCTLFTIYDLLNDPKFLKETVGKVDDKRLKDFWKNEFGRAGDYQIVKMVGGVTARIGKFLHSESARRIFEQPKSTLKFDELMDTKKIIICNLSKGKLSEDISQVIGTAILTKIQLAIMARATINEDERVPFYLYIDEFQNFATDYFVEMLSEARKYKLNIVIVEQSTSQQQDQNLINIILANVAIVICFRTANPADEEIILTQFAPHVKKGEIMNLPWFHFFIKIYAQVAQEPFSGETIPVSITYDKQKTQRIIKMSSEKYGNEYKDVQIKSETVISNKLENKQERKDQVKEKSDKNDGTPEQNSSL